jgi:hypothetical protein
MYVLNISTIDPEKYYVCNRAIANWLIYEKSLPLFGRTDKGEFIFAKTEVFKEVIEQIPFYLKVTKFVW